MRSLAPTAAAIAAEESHLREKFGDAYLEYKKETWF